MPKTTPDEHLTADIIIAHLDGELSRQEEERVQRHLKECWQCRSRAADMEEQIRTLTEARAAQVFPSAGEVDEARRDFFFRFEQLLRKQTNAAVEPPRLLFPAGRRLWRPALFAAAIAAGVVILLVGPDLLRRVAPPAPAEVLAAVQRFEESFHEAPEIVHQTFRVEIIQEAPEVARRDSELETWSAGGRYSARWRDAGGTLRYAVWRPDSDREFIYDPASAAGSLPGRQRTPTTITLMKLWRYGIDAESIERGFLEWVRQRQWRPLSFAANFRSFASQDGVMLHAERVQTSQGGEAMRIAAERRVEGLLVRLVLDVDPKSYGPRLAFVSFERPGRRVEVRLIARRMERLPDVRWISAVFEPDIPFLETATVRRAPKLPETPASRPAMTELRGEPTQEELDSAEIEVRFVLHRLRACLGEPVRVERSASSVRVSGLAETQERKHQILAALADVENRKYVTVDIQSVGEAVLDQSEPAAAPPGQGGTARHGEAIRFAPATPLLWEQLAEYFRDKSGAEGADRRAMEFANSAMEISAAAVEEAWALRRLAERYGPEDARKLRPNSRWLLEILVRDHAAALGQKTQAASDLLRPVLNGILGSATRAPAAFADQPADQSWKESALGLFADVLRMHNLVHGLFGGSALPTQPAQQSLRDLQAVLPKLGAEVRGLENRAGFGFSASADRGAPRIP